MVIAASATVRASSVGPNNGASWRLAGAATRTERNAGGIDSQRALESLLAPIDGAAPRHVAAAGRFGDTAVDAYIRQAQTNHAIEGPEHQIEQRVHHAGSDPGVAAPAQRGRGAGRVSDTLIGTAEHEHLHQFVEDEAIGDARAVTPEGMGVCLLREQHGELVPDRLDDG